MRKRRFSWWWVIIISIVMILIGFIIGFFSGEKVYSYIISPFTNTIGDFDNAIIWTAIAGIGTIFLGFVALKQNNRLHKLEKESFKSTYFSQITPVEFEIIKTKKNIVNNNILIQNTNAKFFYKLFIAFDSNRDIPPSNWSVNAINFEIEIDATNTHEINIGLHNIVGSFIYVNNNYVINFYIGSNIEIKDLTKIKWVSFGTNYHNDFKIHTTNGFAIQLKYKHFHEEHYCYICKEIINNEMKISY